MRPLAAASLSALILATVAIPAIPATAHAFCGFYVAPTDAPLYNDATMVALMRDGNRTVMSMSNNYKGPAGDFAMVVPVPVVLTKENVKTLPLDVFSKLEQVSAPRLVEYWEQDPCVPEFGLGTVGGFGHGAGTGTGMGYGGGGGGGYHVKVEAEFAVGEYQIVILSAQESDGLERWLVDNKYKVPKGAAEALAPYIKEQQKFFVAKVDISKVKLDAKGVAVLSPLRFSYESTDFKLPVRLGLLNAPGTPQDLIVYVLSKSSRYEVANYANAFIPTNLEVTDATKATFGSFYATLFDAALSKAGGKAVITEYAWSSNTCDPCPTPPLDDRDLATLGADTLGLASASAYPPSLGGVPGAPVTSSKSGKVTESSVTVTGKLPSDVIKRIVRANFPRFRACYESGLKRDPTLKGTVSDTLSIDTTGAVESATLGKGTLTDATVGACVTGVFRTLSFPEPEGGKVKVDYTLDLQIGPAVSSSSGGGGFFGAGTPMVLTRLHTRYDRATLGADLVFRAADPVVGGREEWATPPAGDAAVAKPALEKGASGSVNNNFQARYVIRHPWTGKIECKDPRRGNWGGPPEGAGATATPSAAIGLAGQARHASLASYVTSGLDDIASWDHALASVPKPSGSAPSLAPSAPVGPVGPSAPSAPSSATTPSAPPSASASASNGGAPAAKGRCGCTTPGVAGGGEGAAAIALALGVWLRRRRPARP
jgi:hypothetical protein